MLSAFSVEAVTEIPPKYCCGVHRITEHPELEGTIQVQLLLVTFSSSGSEHAAGKVPMHQMPLSILAHAQKIVRNCLMCSPVTRRASGGQSLCTSYEGASSPLCRLGQAAVLARRCSWLCWSAACPRGEDISKVRQAYC